MSMKREDNFVHQRKDAALKAFYHHLAYETQRRMGGGQVVQTKENRRKKKNELAFLGL